MIRVVSVRGLNKPEQRAGVCYVGRAFAGWPTVLQHNPYRSVREYVLYLGRLEAAGAAGRLPRRSLGTLRAGGQAPRLLVHQRNPRRRPAGRLPRPGAGRPAGRTLPPLPRDHGWTR